ncbi:MAG: hypothetical protein E6614_34090 [Bradyrhizobium sp.]|jgi:hypothetical protein|uniref:Uncharacterized protein n=1 Tax=Bradyrhizobium campsiandrae TaxID=1729892 RepID=A0ABR7UKD4_9BRAD|nr:MULTISPECIES: hypothetical protein [Bradyrhizobium]MBC9879964.1 hypothetical protein [Bradyrhizobium campsiandrae]MBC9984563.1 hypothetical protein [Bradyrhizobium campsiandrae]MDU0954803.1 hypothetical protein [Bradyrhizobium sp.]MDU1498025.1 hypothetical protein [Bradyrhizobium sp.]MDU1548278.1 hypothetical protein [Bradyrhizobium sp.]
MKLALLLIAALSFAVPAFAEDYEKGPNGGLMLDVAGVDAELLTAGNTVTINVFVPNTPKPVSTKGFTAAALIASGGSRETLPLVPQGENSLKGDAKNPIAAGATITLTIKTAEGKSGQAKFKK